MRGECTLYVIPLNLYLFCYRLIPLLLIMRKGFVERVAPFVLYLQTCNTTIG
jgi:hypothetical protein